MPAILLLGLRVGLECKTTKDGLDLHYNLFFLFFFKFFLHHKQKLITFAALKNGMSL